VSTHFMQQEEQSGTPNASTWIMPIEVAGAWARYQLKPITGQRHQLRVHMAALGLPIKNDGIYPFLTPEGTSNFDTPLQLLAQSIAFTDPITSENLYFESQQRLMQL
jgi:tRNA pseudouridine32 synthase/23S rRNA pseudouridine746 synthase